MMILSLLLAMQAAPTPAQAESAMPPVRPAIGQTASRLGGDNASPAARQTLARFASCILDQSPHKVRELLLSDFRTTAFNNGLSNLARTNEGCALKAGLRDSLRMGGLPFAAALAEEDMRRMDGEPLNAKLVRAAGASKAIPYSRSDTVAMCVARSVPDDVAAMFATDPASDAETAAVAKIAPVAQMCAQGSSLEFTATGLRSSIATASYHLLAAMEI